MLDKLEPKLDNNCPASSKTKSRLRRSGTSPLASAREPPDSAVTPTRLPDRPNVHRGSKDYVKWTAGGPAEGETSERLQNGASGR